jgi:integrase/recombinase XerC
MTDAVTGWVDHGMTPPQRLPSDAEGIAAYLAEALGHTVYQRWTWQRMIDVHGALPDARRAKPAVCRLLIDAPAVVEARQRGRPCG